MMTLTNDQCSNWCSFGAGFFLGGVVGATKATKATKAGTTPLNRGGGELQCRWAVRVVCFVCVVVWQGVIFIAIFFVTGC